MGFRHSHIGINFTSKRIYIYIYILCKDSICNDLKMVLDSYVKGLNNKICRVWAERLGFGHRTVVNHGICDNRTKVNHVCPRSLSPRHGLGGSGSWPFFPSPFSGLLPSPFILAFTRSLMSTCRLSFLGLILVLSTHTQSG